MTEQQLQKKIISYLEARNYYVVKTVVCNKKGVPDILACSPEGRFIAIEVKAPGKLGTTSALQNYNLQQISSCGGLSIAVDSLKKSKKFYNFFHLGGLHFLQLW
jgi:hypothetical protein